MKKCIVISDSFKGTLKSSDICRFAEYTIPQFFPGCKVVSIPVADGGEGTVDSLTHALGAVPVTVEVSGPYMEKVNATYSIYGNAAIIEMASCAGLPLVGERKDPSLTTTYGVGEVIIDALERGCENIFLGLGGSATNDGGCGCAAALGTRFYNANGLEYIPTGGTLRNLRHVDITGTKKLLEGVQIIVMSDVTNPLIGQNGAARVFGPQKGATPAMVAMLDEGLANMAAVISADIGIDLTMLEGGGAAGGFGAGSVAFLGGKICSGIDAILNLTGFEKELEDTDLVITGEGRLDDQSFQGKVISGITKRTMPREIPVFAIVGIVGDLKEDPAEHGISAVFETNAAHRPFEEVRQTAAQDYRKALEVALRYRRLQESRKL